MFAGDLNVGLALVLADLQDGVPSLVLVSAGQVRTGPAALALRTASSVLTSQARAVARFRNISMRPHSQRHRWDGF